jgi:cephalosporin hydroxylase
MTDNYQNQIFSRINDYAHNHDIKKLSSDVLNAINYNQYAYNFYWMGRPIIQMPQDTVTFQEMIWEVKPDCIIETGIAHGGSLIFSASMLAILQSCSLIENPLVIGIDIDIRKHNREAIEAHPLAGYIHLLEGSSVDFEIVTQVAQLVASHKRVMVFLDSNHTHQHVYDELVAYTPFVTTQSFCVVLDTGIEDIEPDAVAKGRPWCRGNSPKSALTEFLKKEPNFKLDHYYHEKAVITSFPGGIIRRVG